MFYTQPISLNYIESQLNVGASITNIGNKISYYVNGNDKRFLPANLGIGTAYIL